MKMGSRSQSFLREPEFISVFSQDGELENIMERRSNGKFKSKKAQLIKMMHVRGFDKQLIINATFLQNYKLEELKKIQQDFSEVLNYLGCEGVLELHPQDTTQNSYHFHFWTNDDSEETYNIMRQFVLDRGLANEQNVDIQGKYAKFTKGTYFEEDGEERYWVSDIKQKREMLEANANVKSINELKSKQGKEDEYTPEQRKRILKSTVKSNRAKAYNDSMQRLPSGDMVSNRRTAQELLSTDELPYIHRGRDTQRGSDTQVLTKSDRNIEADGSGRVDVLEALERVQRILQRGTKSHSTHTSAHSTPSEHEVEQFFHGSKDTEWKEQLNEIPVTDTEARIEVLRNRLNKQKG